MAAWDDESTTLEVRTGTSDFDAADVVGCAAVDCRNAGATTVLEVSRLLNMVQICKQWIVEQINLIDRANRWGDGTEFDTNTTA